MTKKIEAIVREEKLEVVKNSLTGIGIQGLNVTQVRGRGRQGGVKLNWRNGTYIVDLMPRAQINIIASDDNVEAIVDAICEAARSGDNGDGMIFIYPVDDVVRISTGERGRAAITYQGDIDAKKEKADA